MIRITAFFFIIIGSLGTVLAQPIPEKGVPILKSFTPADYYHQGKIWGIDTAPNGIVYMASDEGMLEYDGEEWRYFEGSEGITRSVNVVNDSVIYTGSDLDFGVWHKNKYSDFEYTSLYPFKEDLTEISEEFWEVHVLDEAALFVSERNIYVYKNQNLTKIPAPNKNLGSFQLGNQVYLVDEEEGLFLFEELSPKKLYEFAQDEAFEIVGMYEQEDTLFLVTQNAGLLSLVDGEIEAVERQISVELKAANVFSFERIGDSYLAFGTILNGLYITDNNGKLLHHINKSKGLQNNTVLSIHYSTNEKLWLGLDYGVSYLDLSHDFTVVYDKRGNFGTAYSALLDNDRFYLGTNQGLYSTNWDDLNNSNALYDFSLIAGTEGQVWDINEVDEQVLISHDRGLFVLQNNQVEKVGDRTGVWMVEPYQNYLLAGTYNGISIYEKAGDEWTYLRQMELIAGSCNQVLVDGQGFLWVNIPNFGVIRAQLNGDLNPENREIYNSEQFAGKDHYLEKGEQGISVITDSLKYTFVPEEESFIEEPRQEVNSRIQDVLLRNGRSSRLNDQYVFYPVYNGFALKDLNINSTNTDSTAALLFRDILAFNNDGQKRTYNGDEISYRFNNLRVQAIVPNQEDVLYQFRTEDAEQWTDWSADNSFEIIGLAIGNHQIKARALVKGVAGNTESIELQVLPPWYRSWYAYAIYLILFIALLYVLYWRLKISMKEQKKKLLDQQRKNLKKQQERFQQRLKRVEQEKLKAEYKNLKAELKNKTVELATKAKENDEKKKVLQDLKQKFEKIEKNPASMKHHIGEIKQTIDANLGEEDNTFEIQMDELHQDFFDALREEFPDLTRYDLRLCAYIKIGFDSKEIADLLNIKPSSVYISRSRLRKKLDIETDEDLHSYLNSI